MAPVSTSAAYLETILRAARDPAVDIDKMERLMRMYEGRLAEEAKRAFISAKIAMRPNLPKVEKNGMIVIHEKGTNKVVQSTPFARFEDIHDAAFPVLIAHGFDLDYRTGTRDGRVTVTAVLSHESGHREETMLDGPLDTSGSKNNIQGVGSTLSYLKRYTMCALLNIRTADKGEFDDDGRASGQGQSDTLSAEQIAQLRMEMTDRNLVGDREAAFFKWIGYPIDEIPAKEFQTCLDQAQRAKLTLEAIERRRKAEKGAAQ